jgi:hypothetical protein
MNECKIEVNNKQVLEISLLCGGGAAVVKKDSAGVAVEEFVISPGDFVTLLNWYRFQKSNGNENLMF